MTAAAHFMTDRYVGFDVPARSRRPRGSAAPPRRRARGSTARPRTPRARRALARPARPAQRRAPSGRQHARGADEPADRERARAACARSVAFHATILLSAVRSSPSAISCSTSIVRLDAALVPGDDQSARDAHRRRRPGGERRRVGRVARRRGDASSASAATTRPASSSRASCARAASRSPGPVGGTDRRRRLDRLRGRPDDGVRPRHRSRARAARARPGVVRLRRAPHLRLLAAARADRLRRRRGGALTRATTAHTSRSTSRPGRSSTTRSVRESRALAPGLVFATERERDAVGALDTRWVVKRGATRLIVDGVDYPAVDATSSTRRARATRSRPASSSAAPSSGWRRRHAAARGWVRCRDPGRARRCAGAAARGVVALETTLVAHGFPPGEGVEVGLASEAAVRDGGCGAGDGRRARRRDRGRAHRGELERFDATRARSGRATSPRRSCSARVGATTVGGTLAVCRAAGIRSWRPAGSAASIAAGRRRPTSPPTCGALAPTQVLVVSSGVKSLLDVPATAELLETLGVPVLGCRTDDAAALLRGARRAAGLGARRVSAGRRPRSRAAHWELGGGGLLARPAARREPRRRRAADRAGARRGGSARRARPGGDAVRPLVPAPRERRPHARARTAT